MTFIGGIAALIASLLPLVGRRGLQKLTGGLKAAFPELLEVALALTSVVFFFCHFLVERRSRLLRRRCGT